MCANSHFYVIVLFLILIQFTSPYCALTDTSSTRTTISLPTFTDPIGNDSTDGCMSCVNFMVKDLQLIINIISKVSVLVSCSDICNPLNNSVDIDMCMTLCNVVGINTFWKIFERADIDPIFACQLINACIIPQFPAAKFISATALPSNVPPGSIINLDFQFQVLNSTGAGQFAYVVYFPQGNTKIIYEQLFGGYDPGVYNLSFNLQTFSNSSFPVGQYPVFSSICAGMCVGKSPYSIDLADYETSFVLSSLSPIHRKN